MTSKWYNFILTQEVIKNTGGDISNVEQNLAGKLNQYKYIQRVMNHHKQLDQFNILNDFFQNNSCQVITNIRIKELMSNLCYLIIDDKEYEVTTNIFKYATFGPKIEINRYIYFDDADIFCGSIDVIIKNLQDYKKCNNNKNIIIEKNHSYDADGDNDDHAYTAHYTDIETYHEYEKRLMRSYYSIQDELNQHLINCSILNKDKEIENLKIDIENLRRRCND